MCNFDRKKLGVFSVGELFDIRPTKAYNLTNAGLFSDDGCNPVIVNSSFNNGVGGFTSLPSTEPAGLITFSDTTSAKSIFYQDRAFVGYPHVQKMSPIGLYKEKWNSDSLRYFVTVFRTKAITMNVDYVNKFTRKLAGELTVSLPITETGVPDFAYMESYMRHIEVSATQTITELCKVNPQRRQIDITGWKPFHIYDFFDIDPGTKLDKVKMKTDNPTVNFVGRSSQNQGITTKINRIEGIEPYHAGSLTLALGGHYLGSCFIQNEPFYTSQNVNVLIPKTDLSFEAKLFFATSIFVESQLHYKAFVKELNKHVKTDFTFYLPVTCDGKPDILFAENYMRSILKKQQYRIEALKSLSGVGRL